MRPTVRVGLVGCGRIAERGYLPALKRTRGVSLAAVADPVIERCHALAPGVASYRDPAALVRAGGIDALVVASPPAKHVDHARLGAEAGLAVLVEKPPA